MDADASPARLRSATFGYNGILFISPFSNEEQIRIMAPSDSQFKITAETAGAVLSALRKHTDSLTWSAARKHLEGRCIAVNGILCVEEARRVVAGDVIELRTRPFPPPPKDEDVRILFIDQDVVVVDKPTGMLSLRHPADVDWKQTKKDRQPSLEESVRRLIPRRYDQSSRSGGTELFAVHRIDRETSGILVFARNESAQAGLIRQFAAHDALRKYLCIIPGWLSAQTLESTQIRDRGDGLRGSATQPTDGHRMVTHVVPLRRFGDFTELECRLETGRTNQIRIQLAELGHPICGDVKYRGPFEQSPVTDESTAPRLALHAAELGFVHPSLSTLHRYELPWPKDMLSLIRRMKSEL